MGKPARPSRKRIGRSIGSVAIFLFFLTTFSFEQARSSEFRSDGGLCVNPAPEYSSHKALDDEYDEEDGVLIPKKKRKKDRRQKKNVEEKNDDLVPLDMDVEDINKKAGYDAYSDKNIHFESNEYGISDPNAFSGFGSKISFGGSAMYYRSVFSGTLQSIPVEIAERHYLPQVGLKFEWNILSIYSLHTHFFLEPRVAWGRHFYNLELDTIAAVNSIAITNLSTGGSLKIRWVFGSQLKDAMEISGGYDRIALETTGGTRLGKIAIETVPPIDGLLLNSYYDLVNAGGSFYLSITETTVFNLHGGYFIHALYTERPSKTSGSKAKPRGFFGGFSILSKLSPGFSLELVGDYLEVDNTFLLSGKRTDNIRTGVVKPDILFKTLTAGLQGNIHF